MPTDRPTAAMNSTVAEPIRKPTMRKEAGLSPSIPTERIATKIWSGGWWA